MTRRSVVLAAVLLGLAGCSAPPVDAPVDGTPTTASIAGPYAVVGPPAALPPGTVPRGDEGTPAAPRAPRAGLRPVELAVPAIGVRTGPLLDLGLDANGALEVPPDAAGAGWFDLSPVPGATGPAVLAAHVNYSGVQGVFARLHELGPGAEIRVRRSDGSTAVFTTYRVERYPKTAFPSQAVYGNTPAPELRLITCGGDFNRSNRQYVDNVVAYARMTGIV